MKDLSKVRKEYGLSHLDRQQMATDPLTQFDKWYQEASESISEANAMVLATSHNNCPSQRLLLLKSYDEKGFVFYTNYFSRKAREIQSNPRASMLFWWKSQERQVRIEGSVEVVEKQLSDDYFASRDRRAQLGALASKQSQIIESRQILADRYDELSDQYADTKTITRPDYWGGYRLCPQYYEFWQGGASRLHDRFCYQYDGETWIIQRLAP